MLLLVFLLLQIRTYQHQYADIYISFPHEKNRRIYLPGIQDSRLQNSLTRGKHQPHPVANFHYKTSM